MAFSDEEENLRKLDKEMVKTYHFGGNFKGQTPQLKAERQKSLKQIYAEIIEKRRNRKKEHEKYLEEVHQKTNELNA